MVRRWFRKNAVDSYETGGSNSAMERLTTTTTTTTTTTATAMMMDSTPPPEPPSSPSLFSWGQNTFPAALPHFDDRYEGECDYTTPHVEAGSVMDALYSLMGDEDLSDVRMQGCDGGTVVAVKAILATRSPVFRARFFGNSMGPGNSPCGHGNRPATPFDIIDQDLAELESVAEGGRYLGKEIRSARTVDTAVITLDPTRSQDDDDDDDDDDDNNNNDDNNHNDNDNSQQPFEMEDEDGKTLVIFEEWDCRVLYLIVEFCYTDDLAILSVRPSDEIARLMASLRSASKTFILPGLLDRINKWSQQNVSRYPALACPLIEEGMRLDDIDPLAMRTVQLRTRSALLPCSDEIGSGVLALSKPGIMFMLRYLENKASHMLLFESLNRWVEFSMEGCFYVDAERERASKKAFASKCAQRFIKISKIPPGRVEEVVASGLIVVEAKLYDV